MNGKARWIGIAVVAIMILALVSGAPVTALDMRSGDEIVIESDEVIDDDLYLAARIITVNGTINGDLVAAGTTVTINGVVQGDLIASGQSVVISGDVGDDARLAAAIITLKSSGAIGDDLVAAGYSLETEPGSQVGGSLIFFGGQAILAGAVQENVDVSASSLTLTGQVGGDVDSNVGGANSQTFKYMSFLPGMPTPPEIAGGLTVQGAEVDGELRYTTPDQVDIPDHINAVYVAPETQESPNQSIIDIIIGVFRLFVTFLIVGLIMVVLAPSFTQDLVTRFNTRWWQCLIVGVIVLFSAFALIFIFLLMIVLLAILLSYLTLGTLAVLSVIVGMFIIGIAIVLLVIVDALISRVILAVWLGQWILRRIRPQLAEHRFVPLLLGLAIIVLILSIPYVGPIFGFVITMAGLGAIVLWGLQRHDERLTKAARAEIAR